MLSAKVIRKKRANYPAAFRRVNDLFLDSAGALVTDAAIREASGSRNTGQLVNSINYRVSGDRAIVGTNVEYAEWVEYGTDPHFPPVEAIRDWAKKVLGDGSKSTAFLIARAISRRGTKAQPFMRPALDANRKKLVRMYSTIVRRVFGGR